MKLTIEIKMGDDALARHPHAELERLLDTVKGKVLRQLDRDVQVVCDAPEVDDKLVDINGNTVGSVKLEDVVRCDECHQALFAGPEECAFCEGKFCVDCSAPGDHQDCLEDE